MNKNNHLPIFGVGPIYVAVIIALTIASVVLGQMEICQTGKIDTLIVPSVMLGILLIIFGVFLWYGAVFRAKISHEISSNKLVTTGVYSLCRNPLYSSFMIVCTGALLISRNVFFYPMFFIYWLFMMVLMKCTEEKWLKDLYGQEYVEYCKKVNRCIPWVQKK